MGLEAWEEAFSNASLVPAKLATMPTAPLIMYWRRSGLKVQPGTEAFTGQMRERPEVSYPTEPNTLYTVMMVDVSIEVEGREGSTSTGSWRMCPELWLTLVMRSWSTSLPLPS